MFRNKRALARWVFFCVALVGAQLAVEAASAGKPAPSGAATIQAEASNLIAEIPTSAIPYFAGDAKAIGHAHGRLLKTRITSFFRDTIIPSVEVIPFISRWYSVDVVHSYRPHIPADLLDEMRAVAAETGLSDEYLEIANASPDVDASASTTFLGKLGMDLLLGCTTYAVTPQASATGGMLVGRNIDYWGSMEGLRDAWQPMVFAKTGKHKILSVHFPGFTGMLTAINDQGVMVSIMMAQDMAAAQDGTPVLLLIRQVLEDAGTAGDAIARFTLARRTFAVNLMITDRDRAAVLELSPDKFAVRTPEARGVLYSANHYEAPDMWEGPALRDKRWPILASFATSGERAERPALGLRDVREIIARAAGFDAKGEGNYLAVLVDYKAGKLYFGSDPSVQGRSAWGKLSAVDLQRAFAPRDVAVAH